MDCAACAKTLQKSVAALDGIATAEVSFGAATLFVAGAAPDADVLRAVSRAGYRARPAERAAQNGAPFWRRDARAISTTASVVLLAVAAIATLVSAPRAVAEAFYLL